VKIVRLAENFKRLRAVNITPEGNIVEIRGQNAQGKSSGLAILSGAPSAVPTGWPPPRRRERAHRSRPCEIIVTRRFTPVGCRAASGHSTARRNTCSTS
jgi:hypothetical protein